MRKFNPDKELYKIQNRNKNKIIVSLSVLLLIVVISYSFALYQVRHTNKLVFNTVGEFKKRDIYLSVLVDGEPKPEFPGKEDGYVFERLDCDKEGTSATFDRDTWELILRTDKPNKCTAEFGTKPNEPELFQGLIPITIDDDGTIKVADTDNEWYNYAENKWANAVLVTTEKYNDLTQDNQLKKDKAGTVLSLDTDILQMYVWIPRYKYQLFNVDNEGVPEQMINVVFERGTENTGDIKCIYINNQNGTIKEECKNKETTINAKNGEWYTHPAFTFKGTFEEEGMELKGIWVGKFEPSDATKLSGSNTINEITIIPNQNCLVNKSLDVIYDATTGIENNAKYNVDSTEIDIHPIKNMDWGAISYLTQSIYGKCGKNGECEMISSNTNNFITGYGNSGGSWESKNGMNASTTGNMYGIYDMIGGAWEYTMGNIVDKEGNFYQSSANLGDDFPTKYYDVYEYSENGSTHYRGHLGDATREVLKQGSPNYQIWYNSSATLPWSEFTWFSRGGAYHMSGLTIFTTDEWKGNAHFDYSFRVVLTAQDGNE